MDECCVWCGDHQLERRAAPLSKYGETVFSMMRCAVCHIRFARPLIATGIDYEAIQDRHYWYGHHRADNEWVASVLARGPALDWIHAATVHLADHTMDGRYRYAPHLSLQARSAGRSLRVLEIGCNLGYFGAVVSRHGHRYTGLDVQRTAIDSARARYGGDFCGQDLKSFADSTREHFDLICAFDTIEHVAAPRSFFDTAMGLLLSDGILVLTTPDGDQMGRWAWDTDLPPIHLCVFTRRTFRLSGDTLDVRFIDDCESSTSVGGFLRLLRSRGFKGLSSQPLRSAALPDLDPKSERFEYAPQATPLPAGLPAFRARSSVREAAKQLIHAFAYLAGLRSIGRTLIVAVRLRVRPAG